MKLNENLYKRRESEKQHPIRKKKKKKKKKKWQ